MADSTQAVQAKHCVTESMLSTYSASMVSIRSKNNFRIKDSIRNSMFWIVGIRYSEILAVGTHVMGRRGTTNIRSHRSALQFPRKMLFCKCYKFKIMVSRHAIVCRGSFVNDTHTSQNLARRGVDTLHRCMYGI